MKIDLKKYAPPGVDVEREKNLFLTGMSFSAIYSSFFFVSFWDEWEDLWYHGIREPGIQTRTLREGAVMEPFAELLDQHLVGYLILALCMFALVAAHYAYYSQGSKSIYLMRRLPDRKYLRRTCWTLPMAGVVICILAALISLLLFFGVYVGFTPKECLPWNYGGY